MDTMKVIIMVVTIAGGMVGMSWAGEKTCCDRAGERYLQALNSENGGVRDSALLQLMKMKMVYPDYDYTRIIRKIEKMSQHDKKIYIRTHAYLARIFMQNPDMIGKVTPQKYRTPEPFFNALYDYIASTQLVMN